MTARKSGFSTPVPSCRQGQVEEHLHGACIASWGELWKDAAVVLVLLLVDVIDRRSVRREAAAEPSGSVELVGDDRLPGIFALAEPFVDLL